ncbi:MAG: fused MFS/spermidine synthase [Actinomycetia bacterium]|nr:fused MFS/spermidine synthase [Actinomycetes bacterium]
MLVSDRDTPGAFLVRVDGADQSFVDPEDPTRLEFDYAQRIGDVIDTMRPPGERIRVVHVGGGGMTLARYVAATRPTSAQIVLEPDAQLTAQVRARLPLPRQSGIKVRPVDGRTGLAALPDDYADLVVLDAFAGARVPAELTTSQWWGEVSRVLVRGGTVTANITDRVPFWYAKRVTAGIADRFQPVVCAAEPATLKGHRFGNLVVSAGGGIDHARLERLARQAVFPYRVMGGLHLARWVGHAPAFTDDDAEQSPPPPGGPTTFR